MKCICIWCKIFHWVAQLPGKDEYDISIVIVESLRNYVYKESHWEQWYRPTQGMNKSFLCLSKVEKLCFPPLSSSKAATCCSTTNTISIWNIWDSHKTRRGTIGGLRLSFVIVLGTDGVSMGAISKGSLGMCLEGGWLQKLLPTTIKNIMPWFMGAIYQKAVLKRTVHRYALHLIECS